MLCAFKPFGTTRLIVQVILLRIHHSPFGIPKSSRKGRPRAMSFSRCRFHPEKSSGNVSVPAGNRSFRVASWMVPPSCCSRLARNRFRSCVGSQFPKFRVTGGRRPRRFPLPVKRWDHLGKWQIPIDLRHAASSTFQHFVSE
jgi:hypothetical protein